MSVLRKRIRKRISALGTNKLQVSKKAGLSDTAVHDILDGTRNRNPKIYVLHAIAGALECDLAYLLGERNSLVAPIKAPLVPTSEMDVLGIAEAGAFRAESPNDVPALQKIHAGYSRRYPFAKHFAFEIRGDSMNACNPPITDGMFVLCVDMVGAKLEIESGRIYLVKRTVDVGQTWEFTVKYAFLFQDRVELRPQSTNPTHQTIVIPRILTLVDPNLVQAVGWIYGTQSTFEN